MSPNCGEVGVGGKPETFTMLVLMFSLLLWDLGQMLVGCCLWLPQPYEWSSGCGKATFSNNPLVFKSVCFWFLQVLLMNTRGPRLVETKQADSSFAKGKEEAGCKKQAGCAALCSFAWSLMHVAPSPSGWGEDAAPS